MAQKKQSKNFMHQKDGVEVGYFRKRKDQFDKSIEQGIQGHKASKPKKNKKKVQP